MLFRPCHVADQIAGQEDVDNARNEWRGVAWRVCHWKRGGIRSDSVLPEHVLCLSVTHMQSMSVYCFPRKTVTDI